MANVNQSAASAAVSSSTEPAPSALDIDQAQTLICEIATRADALNRVLCESIQSCKDNDSASLCVASQCLATQIGWMADLAATKLGGGRVVGGAEEWMLPPIFEKGSYLVQEAVQTSAGGVQ